MTKINAYIDLIIYKKFRDMVFSNTDLKRGSMKTSLEEAMLDYVTKYSKKE